MKYHESEKDNPKEVSDKPKNKSYRDFGINMSLYTQEQIKEVYDTLVELGEPIFDHQADNNWYKDFKAYISPKLTRSIECENLGYSKKNGWIALTRYQIKLMGIKIMDINDFRILLLIESIKLDQHAYLIKEHIHDKYFVTLDDEDIKRIVYYAKQIKP